MKAPTKDKSYIIGLFDNAIEQAIRIAMQKNTPFVASKKNTIVGKYIVHKNDNDYYDIKDITTKMILYKDLSLYDSAIMIAQRQEKGRSLITDILKIDEDYAKHRIDMNHYLNCYKIAKQRNDIPRMSVLEDKFRISDQLSKLVKKRLSKFKIVR